MSVSCSNKPKELSITEFDEFVYDEDNGLTVKQEVADYKYLLSYDPVVEKLDYYNGKNNLKQQADTTVYSFKLRVESLDNKDVIKKDLSNKEEMYYRLEYLNSKIMKDLFLITDKDTNKCLLTQFEYLEGITPFVVVNISFKKKTSENIKVLFRDNLWNGGPIFFSFKEKDLNTIPKIK